MLYGELNLPPSHQKLIRNSQNKDESAARHRAAWPQNAVP